MECVVVASDVLCDDERAVIGRHMADGQVVERDRSPLDGAALFVVVSDTDATGTSRRARECAVAQRIR